MKRTTRLRNTLPSFFQGCPLGHERSSRLDEANAEYNQGGYSRVIKPYTH